MGEFTNGDNPGIDAIKDMQPNMNGDGVDTGFEDVKADGERNGIPVFKVSKNEFYQNMTHGRKRIRFSSGTNVQKYMKRTRYGSPFFIEHGGYLRKVK
jgi:hypothetical protein